MKKAHFQLYCGLSLALVGILAGCNTSAETEQSIKSAIAREVPASANRIWVQNWIVQRGWKGRFNPSDKDRSGRPTIWVAVPGTTQNWPVTGTTFVEFVFDSDGKLQDYKVKEVLTGP